REHRSTRRRRAYLLLRKGLNPNTIESGSISRGQRRMRIYVGGSLRNVPIDEELCRSFAAALGTEIVKQGHSLLNGCRSAFDDEIAKAAHNWLLANDAANADDRIISYCLKGDKPIHN